MQNQEIRNYAKKMGVKLWEIADVLGILDCNFSRKLRKPLPCEECDKLISIIDEIASKKDSEVKQDGK